MDIKQPDIPNWRDILREAWAQNAPQKPPKKPRIQQITQNVILWVMTICVCTLLLAATYRGVIWIAFQR